MGAQRVTNEEVCNHHSQPPPSHKHFIPLCNPPSPTPSHTFNPVVINMSPLPSFHFVWQCTRCSPPSHIDKFAFRGHVGWPAAQAKLRLQCVEVHLQTSLLLHLRWLGPCGVLPELLQPMLGRIQGSLGAAVIEPGEGLVDPIKQLFGGGERGRSEHTCSRMVSFLMDFL